MLDIKWIRKNPEAFDAAMKRRGIYEPDSFALLKFDSSRREVQTALQEKQGLRNDLSKEIGVLKGKGEEAEAEKYMAQVAALKDEMQALEEQGRDQGKELDALLAGLPNILTEDVPDGTDESANKVVRNVGDPPAFDFTPKDHVEVGKGLGGMDFDTAARMSGARFVLLSGPLARMERALAALMLDLHTTEHGYMEVNPPALVRDSALFGTGQLPKFAKDLFRTEDGYWLIPTAEVPLTNIVAGQIIEENCLPHRYTATTWCFRSEAGAAGKDTSGMIRQHQFTKVELVSVVHPDKSEDELERMTSCAEKVIKELGLPYRVVILCSGDTGFGACKTYDIEVWLPGQDTYREISSCSNCGDFQARRMKARFRPSEGKGTGFVHTLNGSGVAVGRTLIAILENYQRADGSVKVPKALRPYMGGLEVVTPDI
jgi:seryl-tRNA synthetase|tara:strand:+ start:24 stop:1310 length:1287 start_codon:yes stop_codon:yes gene_type:complete